jgi:hypothetical protein
VETKTAKKPGSETKKKTPGKGLSTSYNRYKKFGGQQYTGMQIGRGHHSLQTKPRFR